METNGFPPARFFFYFYLHFNQKCTLVGLDLEKSLAITLAILPDNAHSNKYINLINSLKLRKKIGNLLFLDN